MTNLASPAANAAQWALARVKPDYFTWPPEAQERYRCSMSEQDRLAIDKELIETLFNIRTGTEQEFQAALDSLEPASQLLFNAAALLTAGVGDDFFWSLDVPNYTGRNVLAFETLYDYDLAQHTEQAFRNSRTPSVYTGMMQNDWARLLIDGQFSYASLFLAAGHLAALIEQCGAAHIAGLESSAGWPIGPGKTASKRLSRRNASEMQSRLLRYADERCLALLAEFDRQPRNAVYMIDNSSKNHPDVHFVFSDKTALQHIRFRHFMHDCRTLVRPVSDLREAIERETRAAVKLVDLAHGEILRSPPKKR